MSYRSVQIVAKPEVEPPRPTPKERDLFVKRPAGANLPLLPSLLQLPVPLRVDLLLSS